MGSKAALGDIQRLPTNLNKQLGSIGPEGGRQGKGHGKDANTGGNWDCPHCSEGTDNFASRTRCFKCGGNRPKDTPARQERPKQAPRTRSRPAKPSAPAPAPTPHPKMDAMDVEDHQEDAASEPATARSLHEWARKLPQPARDKELPAARKRLELAEGEDKKRKPPAERLQSTLSRVDHRQRHAQAAKDALNKAQQAIEALKAECIHHDALLAKDQEELQVAQSLNQAWGPTAKEREAVSQPGQQPQDVAAAAESARWRGNASRQEAGRLRHNPLLFTHDFVAAGVSPARRERFWGTRSMSIIGKCCLILLIIYTGFGRCERLACTPCAFLRRRIVLLFTQDYVAASVSPARRDHFCDTDGTDSYPYAGIIITITTTAITTTAA